MSKKTAEEARRDSDWVLTTPGPFPSSAFCWQDLPPLKLLFLYL